MKALIIGLAILLSLATAVFGKCGKTVVLPSSKTSHPDVTNSKGGRDAGVTIGGKNGKI